MQILSQQTKMDIGSKIFQSSESNRIGGYWA